MEQALQQVDEELRNVEQAILAEVLSETTAALVQDREAQRRSLKERLATLDARRGAGPLRAGADTVTATLARLDDLLRRDVPRANAVLPGARLADYLHAVKENGRKSRGKLSELPTRLACALGTNWAPTYERRAGRALKGPDSVE